MSTLNAHFVDGPTDPLAAVGDIYADNLPEGGGTYTLSAATASALGGVKQAAAVADAASDADAAAIVTTLNALLASLRTAGIVASK